MAQLPSEAGMSIVLILSIPMKNSGKNSLPFILVSFLIAD